MAQYIDKAAIMAEIERLDNYWHLSKGTGGQAFIERLLSFINTLEVKEVDLEQEIEDYAYQLPHSAAGTWGKGISVKAPLARKYGVVHSWCFDDVSIIARHFYELGLNTKDIKWKPYTEIPTEHWENNSSISPLYLVKCGSVNGNPILGYAHYSYVSNSWMDCVHATERGIWKVLEWTDEKNI